MKKIFLAIVALGCTTFLAAQACMPNDTTTSLVHPVPLNPDNPNGGINKIACIGQPYDFVFTVNVPDTFSLTQPIAIDVPLDSASMDQMGSVVNLPQGLAYDCNPSNCSFLPLTQGCVKLSGSPTTAVQPGVYSLAINFTAYVQFLGAPFATDYTYPDTTSTPDRYYLTVKAANDPACVSGIFDIPADAGTLKVAPSPANDIAFAMAELDAGGAYQMQVFSATGALVLNKEVQMNRGDNLMEIPVMDWTEGVYFLKISNGQKQVKKAFVVAH